MYKLAELRINHFVIATLVATGASYTEIASILDMNPGSIQNIATSPLFKAEVQRIRGKLQDMLADSAVEKLAQETMKSVSVLVEMRDNTTISPTVRLRAADSILDRVPRTSKTQRREDLTPRRVQLSDSQVEMMMAALNDDPLAREAFERASVRAESSLSLLETSDDYGEAKEALYRDLSASLDS